MKRATSNPAAIKKQNTAKSHKLLKAAMRDRDLSSTAKSVLYVLLFDIADGVTLRCHPSFETIAERVGRTRRAIVPAVQELRDRGWVTYESTKGGSSRNTNKLTFCFDRPTSAEHFIGEENVARGEEDCTRTYSEPLSPSEREGGGDYPPPPRA